MAGIRAPNSVVSENSKQRRKLQNRKNQRARRQRLKGPGAETNKDMNPFEIIRWRFDEIDNISEKKDTKTTVYNRTLSSTNEDTTVTVFQESLPTVSQLNQIVTVASTPQSFNVYFPLPSDHLLHLIHYNVFRAFISNKRTLNTISLDPMTCPVFGPCLDDTTRYPPSSNIPSSLVPTKLQLTRHHFPWINIIPFARVRDNLIRREGRFDSWELWQDLVGDLMSYTAAPWQRGAPFNFSSHGLKLEQSPALLSDNYIDADELTAGRNGLIIWGEPHDMQSWEATPGFLTKWSWAVEGCKELVDISNRWRMRRGEMPMQSPMSVLGAFT